MVAAAIGAFVWVRGLEARFRLPAASSDAVEQALTTVHSAEATYTVLVLGVDGAPTVESQPLRAAMLVRVTPKHVTALSVAPDIGMKPQLAESPTEAATSTPSAVPLAELAQRGGFATVIDTVEHSLGLSVNHIVVVQFSALSRLAHGLGGVWVNVPQAVYDPSVTGVGGAARLDGGRQLVDGAKAISVLRALPQGESQSALTVRQRLFLNGLAEALASANQRLLSARLASWLAGGAVSDMSSSELQGLLAGVENSAAGIESASLTGAGDATMKTIDSAATARLVAAFVSGANLAKATPRPPKQVRPTTVTVTVRNGSGVSGLAAQAASILKSQGFRVGEVGNAGQFVYDETLVVYKSNALRGAQRVAKALPAARLVESRGMYAFNTAVLVVVGKDWQTSATNSEPVPIEQP